MTRKLLPVVIRNPRRRGITYRLRDALLVIATLGLWGALVGHSFLLFTDKGHAAQLSYLMPLLKLLAISFAAVFVLLHAWVLSECLRARRRTVSMTDQPSYRQPRLPKRWIKRAYPNVLSYRSGWFVAIIFLTDILA